MATARVGHLCSPPGGCRGSVRSVSDSLDHPEPSAGEAAGEVVGLLGEVVDECVQAKWTHGSSQEVLHEWCRLFGEIVPVHDGEARAVNDGTQIIGSSQVAEF